RPAREITFAMRTAIPVPEEVANTRGGLALSLSPDGHYLVYGPAAAVPNAAGGLGQPTWLRPLDGEAHLIPGSEQWTRSLQIWSPDSRYVAFSASGKLQKAPIGGGPTEVICSLGTTVFSGAWGSSGVLLLAASEKGLQQVPASGGTPAPALNEELPAGSVFAPQFLPDGKHFLFYLASEDADKAGTYLASLGGPAPRLLLPRLRATYARQGGFAVVLFLQRGAWMQQFDRSSGKLSGHAVKLAETDWQGSVFPGILPFAASQTGMVAWHEGSPEQFELVWLDRTGRKIGTLATTASPTNPKVSWQGKRVVYTARVRT